MGFSRWAKISAAIITLLLPLLGAQCQKAKTSSIIDEVRLCGHVYTASGKPIANEQAFIKIQLKGQQYVFKGSSAVPLETVDQVSVGELVRLDDNGLFCTGRLKLDNFYKTQHTKIVSLTARVGEKEVEGFLVKGVVGNPEPTSLYSQAFFNFEKPCVAAKNRFMNDELKEIFGDGRSIASVPGKPPEKSKSKSSSN